MIEVECNCLSGIVYRCYYVYFFFFFKQKTAYEMFSWPGPDAPITMQSERTGIENKWFALTGRVVELKVEEDGDLHIALHDVTGDKPGVVVCEIPAHSGVRFTQDRKSVV